MYRWCLMLRARNCQSKPERPRSTQAQPLTELNRAAFHLGMPRFAAHSIEAFLRLATDAWREQYQVKRLYRTAATTLATAAVNFFAYGTCRNSFGPCAFECGPSTPVMKNCARGNRSPSMFMNGIVPPSPIHATSRPYDCNEACASAVFSQLAVSGAFHPVAPQSASNETFAL